MKLIDPSATIIDRPINQLKLVEEIGRTCYKSNDLITEDSYKSFCNGLLNRKHYAMLEHAVFHFVMPTEIAQMYLPLAGVLTSDNASSHMIIDNLVVPDANKIDYENMVLITANLRTLIECKSSIFLDKVINTYSWAKPLNINSDTSSSKEEYKRTVVEHPYDITHLDYIQILEEDELAHFEIYPNYIHAQLMGDETYSIKEYKNGYYYKRHHIITVKFVCNRAISHELVRHRPCSFAQVSQRYVNYSKDKFGNEIPFIKSPFYKPSNTDSSYIVWLECCKRIEQDYFKLLRLGHKPEEARGVLSNDVATEIYVTATGEEWQHIINLRAFDTTGKAHPQMKEIMLPLAQKLIDMNIGFYNPREVEQDVSR